MTKFRLLLWITFFLSPSIVLGTMFKSPTDCESSLSEGPVATAERLIANALQKGILTDHHLYVLSARPQSAGAQINSTASALPYLTALRKTIGSLSDLELKALSFRLAKLIESRAREASTHQEAFAATKNIFVLEEVDAFKGIEVTESEFTLAYAGGRPMFIRHHQTLTKNLLEILDPFGLSENRWQRIERSGPSSKNLPTVFLHDGKSYVADSGLLTIVDLEKRSLSESLFTQLPAFQPTSQVATWIIQGDGISYIARLSQSTNVKLWPLLARDSAFEGGELDLGKPIKNSIAWHSNLVAAAYGQPEQGLVKFFDLGAGKLLSKIKWPVPVDDRPYPKPHLFTAHGKPMAVLPMAYDEGWGLGIVDIASGKMALKIEGNHFSNIKEVGSAIEHGREMVYASVQVKGKQGTFLALLDLDTAELETVQTHLTGRIESIEFDGYTLLTWPNGIDGFTVFDVDSRSVAAQLKERTPLKPWTQILPFVYKNELYIFGTRHNSAPKIYKLMGYR